MLSRRVTKISVAPALPPLNASILTDMTYPSSLGQPCWTLVQVPKVISLKAQTSASSAASFLAAHSPFEKITDAKSAGDTLTEEGVFKAIFSRKEQSVLAFVKGEPGTGKSHLIRWLKERSDYEWSKTSRSSAKPQIVLVTRGNGSLKDALGQIVRQLGAEFEQHLSRVQRAIDRLSEHTALAMLLAELALEIDTRWVNEHNRDPLPRALRHLGQALRSDGFGAWMKRDGSVIHQVIKRLTDPSSVDERENYPCFSAEDLDVPLSAFPRQTVSSEVFNFVHEDLKEEEETSKLAVEVLNRALRDAVRAMTGLKGDDLLNIFTEVRRQLGPRRTLAVFIEDVSVTGLDEDVVNAFEERDAEGLCQMVAVLGITENGYKKLPDNLQQRPSYIYDVGVNASQGWSSSQEAVAKFAARYLNAVRSDDSELEAIAEERFEGDVRRSRCTECPCRFECHAVFGKVVFEGGVEVGMFPFSESAPHALLQRLTDARYPSQRNLLDHVMLKALDQSFTNLQAQRFPRTQLFPVELPVMSSWAGFVNRFCSGAAWNDELRARLRFLAGFWVAANTAEELASGLQPYLKPLGFPAFSGGAVVTPKLKGAGGNMMVPAPGPDPVPAPAPEADRELERLLGLLDKWNEGQPLQEDGEFRKLLLPLLSKCIPWEDSLGVSIAEKKRLIIRGGTRVPYIDGQKADPQGGTYRFTFPRNAETRDLLQSLLSLSRSSSKTWNFGDGELHKRSVSRWLRKRQKSVVSSIQPTEKDAVDQSLRAAVQALALTSLLRDRKRFTEGRADRINSLLSPVWSAADRPAAVSSEMQAIIGDLEQKHTALIGFVIQEVGAGQGDADPKDFINPLPLLEALGDFEKRFCFESPPASSESGYWAPRFLAVKSLRMGAFESIPGRLKKEQEAIGDALEVARDFMKDAGFANENSRENIASCIPALVEVIDLQRGAQRKPGFLPIPNELFAELWQKKLFQNSDVRASWGVALENAEAVSAANNSSEVAVFNPSKLIECVESLRVAEHHLNLVDQHLQDEENQSGSQGDYRAELLEVLSEISALAGAGEKGASD
jgi:hypothetical protein